MDSGLPQPGLKLADPGAEVIGWGPGGVLLPVDPAAQGSPVRGVGHVGSGRESPVTLGTTAVKWLAAEDEQ
ncbi:hypothetical protein AB0F11_24945 [Streptomyces sp. NPDC032472]|uniref:hypothetical protein n=1 Tax=Streptomyces sp. NPDC032472 TaxID=3155018 RepID=UPI0033F7DE40